MRLNTPEQAVKISQIADGVIVGSAIVKIIAEKGRDSAKFVGEYVRGMKGAMQQNFITDLS